MGFSLTVSEINGDFGRKSLIFPTHYVFGAHAADSHAAELYWEFCNGGY